MTTPSVTPSKLKTYIALAGSILSFVIPLLVSAEDYLPSPWPGVIGGAIAVLTALGVYKAPYTPPGTSVVADQPSGGILGTTGSVLDGSVRVSPPQASTYRNPWA